MGVIFVEIENLVEGLEVNDGLRPSLSDGKGGHYQHRDEAEERMNDVPRRLLDQTPAHQTARLWKQRGRVRGCVRVRSCGKRTLEVGRSDGRKGTGARQVQESGRGCRRREAGRGSGAWREGGRVRET